MRKHFRERGEWVRGRDAWVDALDVRVMRAFFQDHTLSPLAASFRESVAAMAKKVGEDEDTVRYRLRRIQESGFITDWRLFLNPRLWGGGHASLWIDVDSSAPKRNLVEKLRVVPGMTHVTVCYDSVIAFLLHDDERSLPRQVELIRRLAEVPEVFVARDAFPECSGPLTARDWDLIRALRGNPRKPYGELAREVGMTGRTARIRLSKLTAQGAIFEWPSLNMRAASGGAFVFLRVLCSRDCKSEIAETMAAHLEPYLWHIVPMLPYRAGDLWPFGYDLVVPNLSVARQVRDWAEKVPGVKAARTFLYEDIVNFLDEYDEEIDRRLGRMPAATPSVRIRARSGVASAIEPHV